MSNYRSNYRIIAGLGNPGPEYKDTRHNIGFMLIDDLCDRGRFEASSGWKGRFSGELREVRIRNTSFLLFRPLRFMNSSGQPLRELMSFYKIEPSQLVVAHDDIDLPFGALRIKEGGGDGGHNGIKSISLELGTPNFIRVRLGIGRPEVRGEAQVVDWVLSGFDSEERKVLPDMLRTAGQAIEELLFSDVKTTQNLFNRREQKL